MLKKKIRGWNFKIWELSRFTKTWILMFFDFIALFVTLWASFALRFSDIWPKFYLENNSTLFFVTPILGITLFYWLGLYRVVVRFINLNLLKRIALGVFILTLIIYSLNFLLQAKLFPRSVPLIFAFVTFLYLSSSRLLIKSYYNQLNFNIRNMKKVIIYGAGPLSAQLIISMQTTGNYYPVAIVDEDPHNIGTELSGIRVRSVKELGQIIVARGANMILVAQDDFSINKRRQFLKTISKHSVSVKYIPSVDKLISGFDPSQLKPVSINDLLGRDIVNSNQDLMVSAVADKSICITGAGGSIGSEIAHQVLSLGAKSIILYESNENALYNIEKKLLEQMSAMKIHVDVFAILGNVTDKKRIKTVLSKFNVNIVFHAAAYKHVPIVEKNILQGLLNNTIGTHIAACAAKEAGVDRFVLISSDKAVRPTNIMGTTKRFAELLIKSLSKSSDTIYSVVRFGNVLGSSGSVVPIFEEQIKNGGPVKITHPEVKRYFMTISEASSLVIQASTLARGGEIFVLNMGNPIKIIDLAKIMIGLQGLQIKNTENPNGDIEIHYTGLRPGEKLYEELLLDGEAIETKHPMIMQEKELQFSLSTITNLLKKAENSVENQNIESARSVLLEPIFEFSPQSDNIDFLI